MDKIKDIAVLIIKEGKLRHTLEKGDLVSKIQSVMMDLTLIVGAEMEKIRREERNGRW